MVTQTLTNIYPCTHRGVMNVKQQCVLFAGSCEGQICMTRESDERVQETEPYHKVFSALLCWDEIAAKAIGYSQRYYLTTCKIIRLFSFLMPE